jgi:hypothetical protein
MIRNGVYFIYPVRIDLDKIAVYFYVFRSFDVIPGMIARNVQVKIHIDVKNRKIGIDFRIVNKFDFGTTYCY